MIEFEDLGLPENGWEELKRVGGNKNHASLRLWPFMSYRFRVTAVNDVGKSDPSRPSDIHNITAEGQRQCFEYTGLFIYLFILKVKNTMLSLFAIPAPDRNPEDVRSESTDPDTLVIAWEVRICYPNLYTKKQ